MRKAVFRAGLVFLLPLSLMAQSTPQAELMGGYSYARMVGTNMNGWNVSLAGNLNKNLGIVADFSGHYNSESVALLSGNTESTLHIHSFLFGPRLTERSHKWLTPFVHALFGGARLSVSGSLRGGGPGRLSLEGDVTGFAMALGGGLDLGANGGNFALRLVQADFFLLHADQRKHEGLRISAGVVFRLGKRQD